MNDDILNPARPRSRSVEIPALPEEAITPQNASQAYYLALILGICGAALLLHWAMTCNVVA